jgi:hypothetical protein
MSEPVRIFVDEQPVEAPAGATVAAVVSANEPDLAVALRDGRAYVTDGVGRAMAPDTPVFPGAIVRVVRSAHRSAPE